jgi:hypothetical protein
LLLVTIATLFQLVQSNSPQGHHNHDNGGFAHGPKKGVDRPRAVAALAVRAVKLHQ